MKLSTSLITPKNRIIDNRSLDISFNPQEDTVILKGHSMGPKIREYQPRLLKLIQKHLNQKSSIRAQLHFQLFNASTAKFIFDLIRILNKSYERGGNVKIEWIADENNREILDSGTDYKKFCDFPFIIHLN